MSDEDLAQIKLNTRVPLLEADRYEAGHQTQSTQSTLERVAGNNASTVVKLMQLLQLIQLHKWRLQLVHHALDSNADLELSITQPNQLWIMEGLCGELGDSSLMRREAEAMLLEEEVEELGTDLLEVMEAAERRVTGRNRARRKADDFR